MALAVPCQGVRSGVPLQQLKSGDVSVGGSCDEGGVVVTIPGVGVGEGQQGGDEPGHLSEDSEHEGRVALVVGSVEVEDGGVGVDEVEGHFLLVFGKSEQQQTFLL